MKPSNPMQQLQAWKEKHGKAAPQQAVKKMEKFAKKPAPMVEIELVAPNGERVPFNPTTPKVRKPSTLPYHAHKTQLKRAYWLDRVAIRRCFSDFPDHYHHKAKYAAECLELVQRLEEGEKLLNHFTKPNWKEMSETQRQTAKHFHQALQFLCVELKKNAKTVQAVAAGVDNAHEDPDPSNAKTGGVVAQ